jgi:UDP-N-acetylglucosamine diphosphorylase/glucosamine-1-phosphate N-acetyltransferase
MNVVLFEDDSFRTLSPLTHARTLFFQRTGVYNTDERVKKLFPEWACSYLCRPYLAEAVSSATGGVVNVAPKEESLFLNGAALVGCDELARTVKELPLGTALMSKGRVFAAKAGPSDAFSLFGYLQVLLTRSASEANGVAPIAESVARLGIETAETNLPLARFPWHLVTAAERAIAQDWSVFRSLRPSYDASVSAAADLVAKDSIYIGNGVRVEAGAVLDASDGPVILDQKSKVRANAVIYGPCYVGAGTTIRAGAKVYGPCSFGPICKLGGEITETVIQGYSNKQHDGFLGHAYLGEWVNLGAGTEVSDLKNNYSSVKAWVDGDMVDSGERFVGPTIGDHSKIGINAMLNSGCVIGFSCNVFGSEYAPKFVPSFSWGGAGGLDEYDLEKALETARVVMDRRGMTLDGVGEAVFREVHRITRSERDGIVRDTTG